MNNNPYFAGLDKIDTPVNSNSRLFDPQPLTDWFNSFKQKPLTPMQQAAAGNPTNMFAPVAGTDSFANPNNLPNLGLNRTQYDQGADALQYKNYERGMAGLPPFDAKGNVAPVGTGSVLKPMEMFAGYGNVPQGAGMGTPSDGTVEPIFPSLAQPQAVQPVQPAVKPLAVSTPAEVTQPQATQMFTSMYGGNPAEAYSTEALAANTAPIEDTAGSTNLMEFFGLSDMTGKDMLAGAGAALQTGLGAYGMFKTLGQMDTRLDQGQQQIDLSREEYEENLRHRQAIVAQNKGA